MESGSSSVSSGSSVAVPGAVAVSVAIPGAVAAPVAVPGAVVVPVEEAVVMR